MNISSVLSSRSAWALAVPPLLLMSACSNMSRGAVVGAGVGGVTGAVVTSGSPTGAAVGAVIGGVIGDEVDKKDKRR